jgi:hypothetical protein
MATVLSKKEVCDLVGLPVPTLGFWVREGAIKPARPRIGTGKGSRNGNYFSLKQTFILGLVSCLKDDCPGHYIGPTCVRRIVEEAERMPDEEFIECLTTVPDVWAQETTAKTSCEKAVIGPMKDLPRHCEPRMIRILIALKRPLGRGVDNRIGVRTTGAKVR